MINYTLPLSTLMIIICSRIAAPENQALQNCSILSDMWSLGMVMCAIFNNGRSLVLAGNSPSAYAKQLETVSIPIDRFRAPHSATRDA